MKNSCNFHLFRAKLNYIAWQSDLSSIRFSIILGSLFWAFLLLWPGELFTPTRTTYRLMSQIADEEIWGFAFLSHAIFAATTLFLEKRDKIYFYLDALWGALLWTVATVACFASHWQVGIPYAPPAAMSAEVSLMLGEWWWVIRWMIWEKTKKEQITNGYK